MELRPLGLCGTSFPLFTVKLIERSIKQSDQGHSPKNMESSTYGIPFAKLFYDWNS